MTILPMTPDEIREADALLDQYLDEPAPETREQWRAALDKWGALGVNVESLLTLGGARGWLEPE